MISLIPSFVTPNHFVGASNFLLGTLGLLVSVYLIPKIWLFVKVEYKELCIRDFMVLLIDSDFIRTITGMAIVFLSFTFRVLPYMPVSSIRIAGDKSLADYYLSMSWTWQVTADILMPLGTFMIMYPAMADLKKRLLDKIWPNRPKWLSKDASPFVHFLSVCAFCWIITILILAIGVGVTEVLSWVF